MGAVIVCNKLNEKHVCLFSKKEYLSKRMRSLNGYSINDATAFFIKRY